MHFRIAVTPSEHFRIRDVIPLYTINKVNRFAKPYYYKSSYVSILYQERNYEGFGMLHSVFYVKQPVLLVLTEETPRTVIQLIQGGRGELMFKGQNSQILQPGGYDILHLHTDEYALLLQPGMFDMLRFEFEESVMKTVSKTATVKQWLDKLKSGASSWYGHKPTDEKLLTLQGEMQYCPVTTEEQEDWFNDKLDEVFEMITGQSVLK